MSSNPNCCLDGRPLLNNYPTTCFPNSQTGGAAPLVLEDYFMRIRENQPTRGVPFFMGGGHQGAMTDLDSSMRPCHTREPAGARDSLRGKMIPLALSMTPQHYLWQPASDLGRDTFFSTRISELNCKKGPACQVRSFT